MNEAPVMLLKSLTIEECDLMLLRVGDCVVLDTAGFRERMRIDGVTHSQDEPGKFDLHCTSLDHQE